MTAHRLHFQSGHNDDDDDDDDADDDPASPASPAVVMTIMMTHRLHFQSGLCTIETFMKTEERHDNDDDHPQHRQQS